MLVSSGEKYRKEPPETVSHLDHESRCETTVKVSLARRRRAWQRRGNGVVDRRGPARAGRAVDDLRKDVRAHAHALAEQHRLRRDDLLDAEHQVVADLCDEPGPGRPAVDDLAPHVHQERRRERERVPGPAHEERERPRFGARDAWQVGWLACLGCGVQSSRTSGDRCVDHLCACGYHFCGDAARYVHVQRRRVDAERLFRVLGRKTS